jgi:hypothetical protein
MKALALLVLALPAPALAADFYAEADLGARIFLGPGAEHADPGPGFGARMGVGVLSWLSIGAQASGSTHQAVVPGPTVGQYFQLYHTGADVRVRVRAGKVGFFAEGGGGWSWVSTNVLDIVDLTKPTHHDGAYLTAGGGLEYATENPRYAFGVAGDWFTYPEFGVMQTVSIHFYLRYTK